MPEEARENVRLLAIASYFGERALSVLRPTVHIGKPAEPLYGDSEEAMRRHGEDLLRHSLNEAVKLDELR